MKYDVEISGPAERDIRQTHAWWSENRSREQADTWYVRILDAIAALADRAAGCPHAPESDLVSTGLRQFHFGIRSRPTHRIVFAIEGDRVVVLRIRHLAQRDLTIVDLN